MSDEDRDVDIESDEDDDELGINTQFMTQAEKRAHHNALERKRRDHIKESFHSLRDSVPSLQGEKSSRAQILKQATDYITFMCKKNSAHQHDIDDLKRQNQVLEQQVRYFEKSKATQIFAQGASGSGGAGGDTKTEKNSTAHSDTSTPPGGKQKHTRGGGGGGDNQSDTSDSESEAPAKPRSRKKLKT